MVLIISYKLGQLFVDLLAIQANMAIQLLIDVKYVLKHVLYVLIIQYVNLVKVSME